MGALSSKCKPNRISTRVRQQLLQLKSQRDELEHYILLLENNIAQTLEAAVLKAKQNHREQAILLLRKRELLNSQISATRDYLYQILAIISSIEVAQTQVEVVKHLETGSNLLSLITGKIKAANVQELMQIQADNIQELDAVVKAFNVTCSKVDDSILLQELDALVSSTTKAPTTIEAYDTNIKSSASNKPLEAKTGEKLPASVESQRQAVLV